MKTTTLIAFTGTMVLSLVTPTLAAPVYVNLGTAAPPGTLGLIYTMEAFPNDTSAAGSLVASLAPPAAPVSGQLAFLPELVHYEIVSGGVWGTWSHGYAGDVYHLNEFDLGTNVLTMTLPTDTKAFAFYLEPGFFDLYDFSINVDTFAGSSLSPITASINGDGGATGFGFYTDDPSDSLTSITITGDGTWPDGFAVGEFSINSIPNVPDGGTTLLLLGVALSGIGAARRYCVR
jgi:hypothetical protein